MESLNQMNREVSLENKNEGANVKQRVMSGLRAADLDTLSPKAIETLKKVVDIKAVDSHYLKGYQGFECRILESRKTADLNEKGEEHVVKVFPRFLDEPKDGMNRKVSHCDLIVDGESIPDNDRAMKMFQNLERFYRILVTRELPGQTYHARADAIIQEETGLKEEREKELSDISQLETAEDNKKQLKKVEMQLGYIDSILE